MSSTSLDRALAQEPGHYLITRGGARLRLRPVAPTDGPMLEEFFARLAPDDVRFRFLGTKKLPNITEIIALAEVDHRRTEHVLAFDTATGELIASLLLVADPGMETAEVAIAVAAAWKGRGIGYTLLRHATDLAFSRGVRKLRAIESRDNHEALEVERTLGFEAHPIEGDQTRVLVETDLD